MTPKKTLAGFGATVMLMGGIDASVLNETPLERVETIANERIEAKQIGNIVETTLPWKGETGLKVSYDMGEPTLSEKFKDKRNKEVITETVDFGDGGFKVDILLNEKPNTNVFCYQIEGAENYDFFYQPPLTAEEIAEGASRPENIEGSYAVYHKTLKNHRVGAENYATGKVMHIPRPQVWEMDNQASTTEWADLSYIEKDGLCVKVRQEFLDKANYPVRVDPTFGYTSVGASCSGSGGIGTISTGGNNVNPGTSGTVSDMWINTCGTGGNARLAIYVVSSGVLTVSSTKNIAGNGTPTWTQTTSLTPSNASVSNVNYYMAWQSSNTSIAVSNDQTGGTNRKTSTGTYGTFPNPVTWSGAGTARDYSIYATYTASATGSATSTDTGIIWFD